MTSRHRNIGRALALLAVLAPFALLSGACVSKQEARTARQSQYDADFAVVYTAAVESVRELYPTFDDNAATGMIKTAWHQVKFSDPGADDPKSSQVADRAAGAGVNSPTAAGALGGNPSLARRLYFIRFNVVVAGGRPWRVRVTGLASELRPGDALPTELRGDATPHWLSGRTDALVIAIHRKLKAYAIKVPDAPPEVVAAPLEVAVEGDIPAGARAVAVEIARALNRRDYAALRLQVADDVVWSRGAAPGADLALAMWQADPTLLAALDAAVRAGCGGGADAVVCPAAATPGQPRARLGLRAGAWKLIGFVED